MNKFNFLLSLFAATLCFVACDDDLEFNSTAVEAPVLVSSTPANAATGVRILSTVDTLTLTFDKNIYFSTANASRITLNGTSVDEAIVYGASKSLTIYADLDLGTSYTLAVPAGLITGPNNTSVDSISISFTTSSTQTVTSSLSNTSANDATKALYAQLVGNYGSKIYSASMAYVNWNTEDADDVNTWTGKSPAINCFDYLHLHRSGESWIDYGNITPVQDWYDAGGIVAAMWHWNVPTSESAATATSTTTSAWDNDAWTTNYSYSSILADDVTANGFSVTEALTSGTWEYKYLNSDLSKIATYLKQLQSAGIPVLWRPLHEASGAWFWWGAEGASSYVKLWQYVYNYFKNQGLNNLIWVWTSEGGDDADWYPGDSYVDIIGVDIYHTEYNPVEIDNVKEIYTTLINQYPTKMVTLSECDDYFTVQQHWEAGCRWAWFMPWYNGRNDDNSLANTDYSTSDWWNNAMSQDYVISRP